MKKERKFSKLNSLLLQNALQLFLSMKTCMLRKKNHKNIIFFFLYGLSTTTKKITHLITIFNFFFFKCTLEFFLVRFFEEKTLID
jgi:hypothetical protein